MNEVISILLLFDSLVPTTITVDKIKIQEHNHPIKFKQKINYDTKKCYFPNCQIQYFIKQKNCSIDGPSLNFLGLRKHDDCQCYEYVPMFNIINR